MKRLLIDPLQIVQFYHWLCTKPGNKKRFCHPWSNVIVIYELPCGAKLCFLAEHTTIAHEAHAIGQFKYNAGADIDRYALRVTCEEVEFDRCPAFQKMRELVGSHMLDGREYDRQAVTIQVEPDPLDGKPTVASVCHGDGRCGPIAVDYRDSSDDWLPALKKVAAECKYNSNDSCDANVVVSEKAPDSAGKGDAVTDNRVPGGDKNVHGGIIAFFKRLFGRGKKEVS